MAEQRTVVITGSSGRIGTILRRAFAGRYRVRGIDRVPTPGAPDALVASLTDAAAILPAFKGADAVVHLAADPRHTPDIGWATLMPDNVVASANVYEAARQGGVRRLVFFSSMHVCGMYENDPPWSRIATGDYAGLDPDRVPLVTADMPARPDGLYAVSKLFGEALGRYYAEAHGMEVMVVRLGTWVLRQVAPHRTGGAVPPVAPTAPAWLQRAGLGADVMGTPGPSSRGARAEGGNVDYAPWATRPSWDLMSSRGASPALDPVIIMMPTLHLP